MKLVIKNGWDLQKISGVPPSALKTGVKMNKLDSFNKDKIKCKKCKNYYDLLRTSNLIFTTWLCETCYAKWFRCEINSKYSRIKFEDWCKDEQT